MPRFREDIKNQLEAIGIYQIVLPTPFPQAGDVYSFIIRQSSGYALIDAGLATKESQEAFFSQLEKLKIRPEEINSIYITHGHIDHYGFAASIQELCKCPIYIHPDDLLKIHINYPQIYEKEAPKYIKFFTKNGIPKELADALIQAGKTFHYFAKQVKHPEIILPGNKLKFLYGQFKIVHLPGHTPGCIGFWEEEKKILISGDSLLAKISPNPLIELGEKGIEDRFKSLPTYLRTLKYIEQLNPSLVIPSHGECIKDYKRTIATLRKFYRTRQQRILKVLEQEPLTPFQIAEKLFPNKKNEIFLVFSEIIGNLDILKMEKAVDEIENDGKIFYRRNNNELVINRKG